LSTEFRDDPVDQAAATAAGTSAGVEVVCRPNAECLAAAEILVDEGVCPDMSAAIAWLCEAGMVSHRTLFFRAVDRLAEQRRSG